MTEPTINLQKDLELWCDMDAQSFDQQRNQMRDKSGYGRHPTASGGPTIGVEGPENFGATSFDGSNDEFKDIPALGGHNGFTVFGILKLDSKNLANPQTAFGILDGSAIRFQEASGSIRVGVNEVGGTFQQVGSAVDVGRWYNVVGTWDGSDKLRLFVDGELMDTKIGVPDMEEERSQVNSIGSFDATDRYYGGDIATLAFWTRNLNDPEIKQLNRLTGPRRSNL